MFCDEVVWSYYLICSSWGTCDGGGWIGVGDDVSPIPSCMGSEWSLFIEWFYLIGMASSRFVRVRGIVGQQVGSPSHSSSEPSSIPSLSLQSLPILPVPMWDSPGCFSIISHPKGMPVGGLNGYYKLPLMCRWVLESGWSWCQCVDNKIDGYGQYGQEGLFPRWMTRWLW